MHERSYQQGKREMRNGFFAYFLVFFFEKMSGKPGAAAANAISVLMVLRDLITKAEDNCLLNFRRKGCRGQHNLEDDVILALVDFDLDLVFSLTGDRKHFTRSTLKVSARPFQACLKSYEACRARGNFWR